MQLNQNYILQLSIIIMCVKYMARDLYYKQTVFMFHMILIDLSSRSWLSS